jgi:hypothetical protein
MTVIRRVLVHILPGWIVASPSRASRSSNAFVKMGQHVRHGPAMRRIGK